MSMSRDLTNELENDVIAVCGWICQSMQENLTSKGHVDTGALLRSIRHEEEIEPGRVTGYIYADARNPESGAMYAEFIELGTGADNRPGGRPGKWRYRDQRGEWHTTSGMKADPFIGPAIEANLDAIERLSADVVEDIAKYWKLKGGEAS